MPDDLTNDDGVNVTDLKGRIDTGMYLTPHSDIVALMVLEHQAEMHNRITARRTTRRSWPIATRTSSTNWTTPRRAG